MNILCCKTIKNQQIEIKINFENYLQRYLVSTVYTEFKLCLNIHYCLVRRPAVYRDHAKTEQKAAISIMSFKYDNCANRAGDAIDGTELSLNLNGHRLRAQAFKNLGVNSTVKCFEILRATFDDEAAVLEHVSKKLPGVRCLTLADCGLEPSDAPALCKYIIDNKQLRSIELTKNSLSNEGALQLANALKLSRIEKVDLTYNKISDKGATALNAVFRQNKFLKMVDLDLNEISSKTALLLLKSSKQTKFERLITVSGNSFDEKEYKHIYRQVVKGSKDNYQKYIARMRCGVELHKRSLALKALAQEKSVVEVIESKLLLHMENIIAFSTAYYVQ